jgi:hypothetical protein
MRKLVMALVAAAALAVPASASATAPIYPFGGGLTVSDEPAGENCEAGGIKVETPKLPVWDSVARTAQWEIQYDTFYVCNGVNGAPGANGLSGTNGKDGAAGQNGAAAPSCTSKRTILVKVREPKGHQLSSATVSANGKTAKAHRHRDGRLYARADFVGVDATKGQIVPVYIKGVDHGKTVSATRLYRLCTPDAGVLNLPIVL